LAPVNCFCDAKVYETGYCAGPIVSITSSARWISTDPSVVALTTPGRFLVRKAGMSVIYAESDTLYSRNAYGYRTDVAGSLQQIGVVDVMVCR
jgi:hypothetical protein